MLCPLEGGLFTPHPELGSKGLTFIVTANFLFCLGPHTVLCQLGLPVAAEGDLDGGPGWLRPWGEGREVVASLVTLPTGHWTPGCLHPCLFSSELPRFVSQAALGLGDCQILMAAGEYFGGG